MPPDLVSCLIRAGQPIATVVKDLVVDHSRHSAVRKRARDQLYELPNSDSWYGTLRQTFIGTGRGKPLEIEFVTTFAFLPMAAFASYSF